MEKPKQDMTPAAQDVPAPQQQLKLGDMKDHELGIVLNQCHNLIHQANSQIMMQQQNITKIMAEVEKRDG